MIRVRIRKVQVKRAGRAARKDDLRVAMVNHKPLSKRGPLAQRDLQGKREIQAQIRAEKEIK